MADHGAAAHAGRRAAPAPLAAPRARRRATRSATFEIDRDEYQRWLQSYSSVDAAMRAHLAAAVATLGRRPLISVIMPSYNIDPKWMRAAIESVRNQIYPHWELCISDDASTLARRARADRNSSGAGQAHPRHVPRHQRPYLGELQHGARSRHRRLRRAARCRRPHHRGRAVLGRARDRARSANRHDLLRRGQDRPRRPPLRSLLQAGVESRADARAEHVLPSRRLPPQPGRAGRPLPRRLRGRAGSRSGAALRRRDHARAHPPHPARALSLARDRAVDRGDPGQQALCARAPA